MKAIRLAPVLLLLAGPAALAQGSGDPPTLFERWEARKRKDPALEQKLLRAPEIMKKAGFMVGRFEVTEKVYATSMTPETRATGTRESRFDLDGHCLTTRQTVGNLKTVDALVFDPYQEYWFRQIMTNGGRGALQPLVATSGWDNGALVLTGALWAFGEKADVKVRIQKLSDDAYSETWEERFGGMTRPLIEYTCKRLPEGKPAKPAAAK